MTDLLDRCTLSAVIVADELLAAIPYRPAGHMGAAGMPTPPTECIRVLQSRARARRSMRMDSGREVHLILKPDYAQPWLFIEQHDNRGRVLAMGSDVDGLARWLADWLRRR